MTHTSTKKHPLKTRYQIVPIAGNCLEMLGIHNRNGGFAIVDRNRKPVVGDVVLCLLHGGNVTAYLKQVKEIKENSIIVGTAYFDPEKDFQLEADEILGVVLETYGKARGYREYIRPAKYRKIQRDGGMEDAKKTQTRAEDEPRSEGEMPLL